MRTEISDNANSILIFGMLIFLVMGLRLPAFAGLGASVKSVADDQLRMQARIITIPATAYTIHELKSSLGVVVREYSSLAGKVFAVSWNGPFVPDMHQLLANYFELYSREIRKQNKESSGHSSLDIRTPSLVVENTGHMRAYVGRAYDPSLLPAGVNVDDIR